MKTTLSVIFAFPTQAELDELVRAAGFSKVEQWIDDWGMFTVSLARRN